MGSTPQASPQGTAPIQGLIAPPQQILDGPLLSQYFSQTLPKEDETAEGSHVSATQVLRNFIQKQTLEIKEATEISLPRVAMIHDLRKSFREFSMKQMVHLFDFLEAPIPTAVSQVQQILKRFGRTDFQIHKVKIKDLCLDMSCNSVVDSMNQVLEATQEQTGLQQWTALTKNLFTQWKLAAADLQAAEKILNSRFQLQQEIYKKVQTILSLPSNPAQEQLLKGTEEQMKQVFEENKVEDAQHQQILAIKKVSVLADAMNQVRFLVNSPVEPQCTVCLNEPVTHAAVPCGHTFCAQCITRQSMNCQICRGAVKERMKIFLS